MIARGRLVPCFSKLPRTTILNNKLVNTQVECLTKWAESLLWKVSFVLRVEHGATRTTVSRAVPFTSAPAISGSCWVGAITPFVDMSNCCDCWDRKEANVSWWRRLLTSDWRRPSYPCILVIQLSCPATCKKQPKWLILALHFAEMHFTCTQFQATVQASCCKRGKSCSVRRRKEVLANVARKVVSEAKSNPRSKKTTSAINSPGPSPVYL